MLNIFKKNTIFGRNTTSDLPLYYDDITVEGETTQETRNGINLLNVTASSTTSASGVTITVNQDKSITLNGTNNQSNAYWFRLAPNFTLPAGAYTLFNGNSNAVYSMAIFMDDNHNFATKNVVNATFNSSVTIAPYIRINPNATLNNLTIYPMIVEGTYLEDGSNMPTYEQYGLMPSPNYPSDLISVGYENLLGIPDVNYSGYGLTIKSENGVISVNGTATSVLTYDFALKKPIKAELGILSKSLNPQGTYTNLETSLRNSSGGTVGLWSTNGSNIINTISSDAYKFRIQINSGVSINAIIKPQVEKGTQPHSYIEYGKYGIEIITQGKNWLDFDAFLKNGGATYTEKDGIYNINSMANTYTAQYPLYLKPNTTYSLSQVYQPQNSTNLRLDILRENQIVATSYATNQNLLIRTFTTDSSSRYTIRANWSAFSPPAIYNKPMLEEGLTTSEFVPYVGHKNLIILNSPLRSIDNKKDILTIKNNILYIKRYIGSVILNGSEVWSNQNGEYDTTTRMFFSTKINNISTDLANRKAMSNYFKYSDITVQSNIDITAFNFHPLVQYSNYIYFKIEKSLLSTQDATGFANWVSNHNIEVQYVLATPTIETYELNIQPMIFDSLGYGTLSDVVSDPLITEELNGSYILELEYMKNGKFSEYLVEENIIKAHGEPFSIYSVEKDTDEKIKILAKHWVINEWDKDFILDSAPTDLTAQNALAWIQQRSINHSDISISGDCTTTSTARYVRKNMLSAIFKEDNAILTRFGGELSYNKNNVSVNKHRGSLSGLTIRQGKNLTGAKYYLDFSTVTTRLVPVGKDGLMLDEVYVDSPLINNYATPIIRKVEVNTTSKDELRSYCNKLYENGLDKPTVSIKIDFIELSKTDEYKQYSSLETAHLGDEVTAYIPSLNLDVSTRIVKTVYNDNLKRITALELGSVTPNIATSSVNVEKNLQKQVEQLAANDLLILDEAKEEASNLIKHPFGGYIYIDDATGNMYIMDTNDINTAQNVWRWGLGGLGFSSTGVNGTYGIAMTQDGKIVADYIKSGTLQSVTIKATNGTVGGYNIGENKLYAETYSSYNFDSSDLTAIRNYLMDEGSLSDDELIKYDIDGNGVVDSRDYVLIRNFIELGVTKNKSAKIIMQTGNNIFENAYILQDANANDILNINFNGFIYDHPNNGKFNLSGSKLTLTDINNNSMTISPDWLPKSVLSNWYSTSSTTLTDAKKHKLLVILGKPTSSSGIVSLIIPTDALSTSNQQFQCADESKYVAFNVRYNNDDVIITGAGRSSDGSILSAWTLL